MQPVSAFRLSQGQAVLLRNSTEAGNGKLQELADTLEQQGITSEEGASSETLQRETWLHFAALQVTSTFV
jgi:hypothetical protein